MKQLVFLSLLFVAKLACSQSGLQFSQVKFLSQTITGGSSQNLGTVPSGKVWKLENVQHSNSSGYSLASCTFKYNGSAVGVIIPYQTSSTGSLPYMSNNSPIWWPAGTVIDVGTGGSGTHTLYFSIIEFSVVP